MSGSGFNHLAAAVDSFLNSKLAVGSTFSYVKNECTRAEQILVNFEIPITDRVAPRQKGGFPYSSQGGRLAPQFMYYNSSNSKQSYI